MQKKTKRIILLTILLLIILSIIILLTQNTNKPIPQPLTEQAKAQYETIIGNQPYDITKAVLEPTDVAPTISAGMIPVKWNGTNWVITAQDKDWYDYAIGKPAYIMLNDGYYKSEIEQGIAENRLMENNVETIITRTEDLGTIYMWIPRFAYNTQGEILYIKQTYSVAGTYTMPEIFTYETEKRDFSLSGIWVEYNPLTNTSVVNTKINNMKGPNNKYGFIANTIGTNANNETTYKTTIETYINALSIQTNKTDANIVGVGVPDDPQINETSNQNRTIIKITNSNQLEPIKGTAYYDETERKIEIEVTYSTNTITQILDSKGKVLSDGDTTTNSGDEKIGNKNYKFVILDEKGNQKQLEVKVSGLDIYIIENEADLKYFRDAVNNNKTTSKTEAYQIADVYMNEGKYTVDENSGDITFASDAEQWVPIGKSNSYRYSGIYYGNDYSISGLYINQNTNKQGLFSETVGATIQDLNLINSSIKGNQYVGGFVATALTSCTITNCNFSGNIEASAYTGGIVANVPNSCTIDKCSFSGNMKSTATSSYSGGIVGDISTATTIVIMNCGNNGVIEGKNYIGGIIGNIKSFDTTANSNMKLNIINCYNNANMKGNSYIGGIVGQFPVGLRYNYAITNCHNNADIFGVSYIGGIIGNQSVSSTDYHTGILTNLYNIGKIQGTKDYIGRNSRLL